MRSVRQRLLQILPTLERGYQSLERPLLFVSAGGVDHELPVSGDEVSGRRWGGDFGLVMAASREGSELPYGIKDRGVECAPVCRPDRPN